MSYDRESGGDRLLDDAGWALIGIAAVIFVAGLAVGVLIGWLVF